MESCGRYEVDAEIGRGAMGVVYAARDPRLGRQVALKTLALPQGLPRGQLDEFRQRFRREAHAAATLSHPAIVTVYDADEDPATGVPFIVMEYVEGRSLRELLRGGSLAPEYAIGLATDIAAGLQSAHDAGVVHRDLKPENLLVRDRDGSVKIADFGVARVPTSELTQSGTTMGTPSYMSPEQIAGRPLDGRSDLFTLAVTLYEALCGERPFAGETVAAVVHSVMHETPSPVCSRVAGLPVSLDRFFERALAKDPDDRYPSATSFRDALLAAWRERDAGGAQATASIRGNPPSAPSKWSPRADLRPTSAETTRRSASPSRRRAIAVGAILLLVCTAWLMLSARKSAHLQLDARSSVSEGELALLVDGDEVYSRRLAAPQKPRGWIKKIFEPSQETFEAWIPIAAGKHEVTAEIHESGRERPHTDTIVVDLGPGETRKLRLVAGRAVGQPISLKLD